MTPIVFKPQREDPKEKRFCGLRFDIKKAHDVPKTALRRRLTPALRVF
jgi:hypothetical protein